MTQDWDIKPLNKICLRCQAAFADHQRYWSMLAFGKEGYTRADFCEPCWQQATDKPPVHSAWQGVYRMPPPEPERSVKKETAESLLRGLIAQSDASNRNVIYILAVMLERQRLLVEREVRPQADGSRVLVYEHRKTADVFLVPDPQLRLDQLDQVQAEVMALITASEAAAAAAAAPGAPPDPVAPPDPAGGV